MTEDSRGAGRIDLRVLDEPTDPSQAERVVRAALARAMTGGHVAGTRRRRALRRTAPLLAAAALLLLAAGALLVVPRRSTSAEPGSLIADWTVSSHVPTNGELLAAFQGYQR